MRNNKLFNNDNYNWNIDDMKKQKIYPLLSTLNVPSFVKDFGVYVIIYVESLYFYSIRI